MAIAASSAPASAPRARHNLFSGFWLGRIIGARILPIVLLVFLTYNSTGYSWVGWALYQWNVGIIPGSGDGSLPMLLLFYLATLLLFLAAWGYILRKSKQALGGRIWRALVPICIFGLIYWLLLATNVVSGQGVWNTAVIQLIIGIGIGICFSLTLIDRHLSGTLSAHVTSSDVEQHHGDPSDQPEHS